MTVALSLVGCATPSTLMKNPTTGQIARCGGDASGSMMGGYIGYSIQKSNDEQCVKDYASQGFIPIQES
ncbi:MAG TPA: hypothetical protein VFM18_07055, partial [Methanosarcina sp.]|nr:hypothetical protein [Methanosarcina sp.]